MAHMIVAALYSDLLLQILVRESTLHHEALIMVQEPCKRELTQKCVSK